jgi:N-acetylmuramic acid 6-phosphate (MurNAc-6-P) etherase
MPLGQGIDLMLSEDATLSQAIRVERKSIQQVIAKVVQAFESGGRLFYAGAGTSGRLGVLDASEIPPTFRAPREQVQGIIAGDRANAAHAPGGIMAYLPAERQRQRQLDIESITLTFSNLMSRGGQ